MAKPHLALVTPPLYWDSRAAPPTAQTGTQCRGACSAPLTVDILQIGN